MSISGIFSVISGCLRALDQPSAIWTGRVIAQLDAGPQCDVCQSDLTAAQDAHTQLAELSKWKRSEGPEKSVLKNKTPVAVSSA